MATNEKLRLVTNSLATPVDDRKERREGGADQGSVELLAASQTDESLQSPAPSATLIQDGVKAAEPGAHGEQKERAERNPTANNGEDKPGLVSLLGYLKEELVGEEFDGKDSTQRERLSNFFDTFFKMEKVFFVGWFVCLDAFLSLLAVLPFRILIALGTWMNSFFQHSSRLRSTQKCDLLKGLIFFLVCGALFLIDGSRLYHSIRGQSIIKLYVIFNVLEVLDRLCYAFGVDILDSLFSRATVKLGVGDTRHFRPVPHFVIAFIYSFAHSLILFYQMITLNVAVNSSNALFTLLLSNQFMELKSSVFKKCSKEGAFQVACSDIVERFQLHVFLLLILLRNLSEVKNGFTWDYLLNDLLFQLGTLMASELLIDWLKHAFITKFNDISPSFYESMQYALAKELGNKRIGNVSDQAPAVARRIGFESIPLGCLFARVLIQSSSDLFSLSLSVGVAVVSLFMLLLLFGVKVFIGIKLQSWAARKRTSEGYIHCDRTEVTLVLKTDRFVTPNYSGAARNAS